MKETKTLRETEKRKMASKRGRETEKESDSGTYVHNYTHTYKHDLPHWCSTPILSYFIAILPFPSLFFYCCCGLDISTIFAFARQSLVLTEASATTVCILAPHQLAQMLLPPQSLHKLFRQWCSQRLTLPQSLHSLRNRWYGIQVFAVSERWVRC